MTEYASKLTAAMHWLAEQPDTVFIGQSVKDDGAATRKALVGIDPDRLIEFPVAEQLQLGVSIGMALENFCPVSIFPRFNFLISAADQLINHLDRIPIYSGYRPRVLIRTAVGRNRPLDPGPQHQDDFTEAFTRMLRTVEVKKLDDPASISVSYEEAYFSGGSALLVEDGNRC
jgi:pyruvate/2-oxoglutarate/acetoin dehydrogenase E1 component